MTCFSGPSDPLWRMSYAGFFPRRSTGPVGDGRASERARRYDHRADNCYRNRVLSSAIGAMPHSADGILGQMSLFGVQGSEVEPVQSTDVPPRQPSFCPFILLLPIVGDKSS